MKRLQIKLSGIQEMICFIEIINQFEYHCDLCCGSYVVDAKSLLGVVSLQGASNVELVVYDEQPENLIQCIGQFCC